MANENDEMFESGKAAPAGAQTRCRSACSSCTGIATTARSRSPARSPTSRGRMPMRCSPSWRVSAPAWAGTPRRAAR